ncbi:MAG: zinc ABC transporter substrate-binding protein [Alphaproteobacteria bacterium]
MRIRPAGLLLGLLAVALPGMSVAKGESGLRIAATIAPVHSLVAMVSAGIAEPDLIVRPGASPHDYALKPSEAAALDGADLVFWVGEGLEPWMAKAVTTLAADALVIELGKVEGTEHLAARKGGVWGAYEHGHAEEQDHHAGGDPHLWLDPGNALVWLAAIAETLADHDPAHADTYRQNAEQARQRIEAMTSDIETRVQPIRNKPYVVFHDAFHYFEHRFGLHPLGAISLSDADHPGPARLRDLRQAIAESGAVCVFAEPQFEPKLIETVTEGTDVKTGTLDPIGAGLQPGADLYPELVRGIAESLADCLGG